MIFGVKHSMKKICFGFRYTIRSDVRQYKIVYFDVIYILFLQNTENDKYGTMKKKKKTL